MDQSHDCKATGYSNEEDMEQSFVEHLESSKPKQQLSQTSNITNVNFPPFRLTSDSLTLTDVDQHNRAIANEKLYHFRCMNSHLGSHLI